MNAYVGLPAVGHTLSRWERELWLPTKKKVDLYLCTEAGEQEFHWLVETDNRNAGKFDHDMTSQYATLWSFWHLLQKNEELELKYGYQHFRALTIARDPQRLPKLKAQAQSVYRNDPYGPLIF